MKKQSCTNAKVVKYTKKQVKELKDKTNYEELDSVAENAIDYSDIPETDALFWAKAKVKDPCC